MSIGQRIKQIRKEKGITQKQLAEKLNVTPALVSAYENGKRNPKLATLKRISEALGVPFGILDYSFETSPPQRLKYLRNSAGLTQEELADKISVSVDTIAAWENGNKTIRYDDLKKLMDIYGLAIHDFISEFQSGDWEGIFKPLLVPDSAYLELDPIENDLMPDSYNVYYDQRHGIYYITYPDGYVIKTDYEEYSRLIDSSQSFNAFQFEQFKQRYIDKLKKQQ